VMKFSKSVGTVLSKKSAVMMPKQTRFGPESLDASKPYLNRETYIVEYSSNVF
jgi:hypothetical protein